MEERLATSLSRGSIDLPCLSCSPYKNESAPRRLSHDQRRGCFPSLPRDQGRDLANSLKRPTGGNRVMRQGQGPSILFIMFCLIGLHSGAVAGEWSLPDTRVGI